MADPADAPLIPMHASHHPRQIPDRPDAARMSPTDDCIHLLDQSTPTIGGIKAALDAAAIATSSAAQHSIEATLRSGTAAAIVISGRALMQLDFAGLTAALGDQPRWLDTLIIAVDIDDAPQATRLSALQELATVMPLRGPDVAQAAVDVARAALRLRRKARLTLDHIDRCERAERDARAVAEAADAKVEERTAELATALSACSITGSELRASDERNRATIELSDVMVFTADAAGNLTSVDDRYYALTDADRSASVSIDSDKARVHPDDRERVRAIQIKAQIEGTRQNYEYRGRVADGSYRWWQLRAAPLRGPDGTILRWHGTLLDIHDRKVAENQLRESEDRHRFCIELSNLITYTASAAGKIESIDESISAVTGVPVANILGSDATGFCHPDDLAAIKRQRAAAPAAGGIDHVHRLRSADGSYGWWRTRARARYDADGRIVRWYGTLENIDELRRAEAKLRESEELHRFSLELSDLVVWSATTDGIVTDVGDRLFEVAGVTREQMFSGRMRDWLHEGDADRVFEQRRRSLADGTAADFDFRMLKADGDFHWWRWRSAPLRDASGRIIRWYGTLENIDALRRAEERLRASEELHRFSIELSNLVVWTGSAKGELLGVNARIFKSLGLTREMTASLRMIDLAHPDDLGKVAAALRAGVEGGVPADLSYRLRHADGTYRWWRLRAAPQRSAEGETLRWYGTLENIDELKVAEQKLRESEEMYRYTIELSNQIVFTTTADGMVTTIGGNWAQMTGLELDSLDQSALDTGLCHPEDAGGVLKQRISAYRSGLPLDQTFRMIRPDGSYRWWRLRASPRRNGEGEVDRWYGTIEDVDALHRAEAARHEADAIYRHTIEASGQLPWSASADGSSVTFDSIGTETSPDLSRFDLNAGCTAHPDDVERVQINRARAYATGDPLDHAYRLLSNSGEYRWWRSRGSPHRAENGNIIRWYGTLENIDAAKRSEMDLAKLQSEVAHMSRLSAMGAMASTLAHELNQPLAAVVNYIRGSRHLMGQITDPNVNIICDAMQSAEDCAMRASKIIRQLRKQVSRGQPNNAHLNVARLIDDSCAIGLINNELLGIKVKRVIENPSETVYGDSIQLQQILINLLRNAVDAVSTVDERVIVIDSRRAGGFCAISVSDSGPGVAADMADRLYEPYLTSKKDGVGIGLSISRTIAESHGGRIDYGRSSLGGACFTAMLPIDAS